jgi:O-antigen/teichoic acid export membrane protein
LSLLANGAAMLAARLMPPVFGFAINVGIARVWGTAGLGTYVYLTSLLLVFQAVAGAGMSLLLVREIAARPEDAARLVAQGRAVGLVSGLFATVAFALLSLAQDGTETRNAGCILALSLLPTAWITVQEACFVARRRHHVVALTAAAENVVKLSLAAAAFFAGGGLVALCAAITIARVCSLLLGQRLLATEDAPSSWRLEVRGAGPLARALPPFAGMLVLAILYFRVDVLVVQSLRPEAETGLYAAALTLYTVAILLPESALSAVYPRLAHAFHTGHDGFGRGTWLAAKLLAVALVPVSIGMIALAEPVLAIVYGHRFDGAAEPLALLAASLPLHALNGAFGQALQASGHQRAAMRVAGLATGVHLVMTIALVSTLGLVGAPIAVLTSSTLAALATGILVHRHAAPLPRGAGVAWTAVTIVGPIGLALAFTPAHAILGGTLALVWLALALGAERLREHSDLLEAWALLRPAQSEARA